MTAVTANSTYRRNLLVPKPAGERHWRVFQTLRDYGQEMTFHELKTLTNLAPNKLAASLDYLCRHTYVRRTALEANRASYSVTGRQANTIEDLLAYERPRPLTNIRGLRGAKRPRLIPAQKGKSTVTGSVLRPLPSHSNGIGATAFVRLMVNNQQLEVSYAEANRLWNELGKVFVAR